MISRIVAPLFWLLSITSTGAFAQSHVVTEAYFDQSIKPIFESRCIQCHSCYNAPCQLNLGSVEGLDRGLVNGFDVFDAAKLSPAAPSRLGIDRKTTEGWRNFSNKIHFMPVTQNLGNAQKNIDTSFILKLVEHKKSNSNLIVDDLKNPKELSESSRVCPDTSQKLAEHLMTRPNAGMPYGLPALTDQEIQRMKVWTMAGSPRSFKAAPISRNDAQIVAQIENFLNAYLWNRDLAQAKRQSLVSRYIYEHLFLSHVYVHQKSNPESFYRVIRSRSSCESADEIATRRPWDDTNGRFFYCLKRNDATIVNKTHMPYLVNAEKLQRWNKLFFSTPWSVSFEGNLADAAPRSDKLASNPFHVYKDMPAKAKYQFLLDDAQYHVMTFIKGPVCKGSTAVNSIDEQFYVFFMKPESDLMVRNRKFTEEAVDKLYLPAHKSSGQILGATVAWFQRKARNNYRILRDQYYGREFPKGYSIDDIWDGKDTPESTEVNTNAALTVLRHEDSAVVVKGLVGATSKTVFVLDYSIFERIYYNLVAGFDVYGDASHQLHTRLYMSYTKMEAEENFLSFLPRNVRSPMRRSWYLQASHKIEELDSSQGDIIAGTYPLLGLDKASQVNLPALNQDLYDHAEVIQKLEILRDYRHKLIGQFKQRLGTAVVDNNQLNPEKLLLSRSQDVRFEDSRNLKEFENEMAKISDLPALNSKWVLKMPSASLIVVESPEGAEIYTLVRNKEHLNIAWLSHEKERRNEAADTMIFYKGVMTSYPNYIFRIKVQDGRDFLQQMTAITDHNSYDAWTRRFGSPRSGAGSEKFWPTSDRLHQVFRQNYPLEYGALDYNRYGADYRYNDGGSEEFFKNLPRGLRMSVQEEIGAK